MPISKIKLKIGQSGLGEVTINGVKQEGIFGVEFSSEVGKITTLTLKKRPIKIELEAEAEVLIEGK